LHVRTITVTRGGNELSAAALLAAFGPTSVVADVLTLVGRRDVAALDVKGFIIPAVPLLLLDMCSVEGLVGWLEAGGASGDDPGDGRHHVIAMSSGIARSTSGALSIIAA